MSHQPHSDESHALQCGHDYTGQATVAYPGKGTVCRSCLTPIALDRWDQILRTTTEHHTTGETSTYDTWLVGLDAYGRGIYHDELNTQLLRVVPMYHPGFRPDRTGDESPLREYPSDGPGYGRLLNAPDGRDLLVSVEEIDIDADDFSKRELVRWVGTQAADGHIKTLSDAMCDLIERYVISGHGGCFEYEFPVEAVEPLLSED